MDPEEDVVEEEVEEGVEDDFYKIKKYVDFFKGKIPNVSHTFLMCVVGVHHIKYCVYSSYFFLCFLQFTTTPMII